MVDKYYLTKIGPTKIHLPKECALYPLWSALTMFQKLHRSAQCKFRTACGDIRKNCNGMWWMASCDSNSQFIVALVILSK